MKKSFSFLIVSSIIIGGKPTSYAQNIGIGTTSPTNKLEVVSAVTPQNSASILGINNGTLGAAIAANTTETNTYTLVGSSNNGIGVQGYTSSGKAIWGLTSTGIALSASSITGKALEINGNLKIDGGNTNPTNGAVLTSDATGNARWKKRNFAFSGKGTLVTSLPQGTFTKVEITDEPYDINNNFEDYQGGVTANSSTFLAPVAGIYRFSAKLSFQKTGFGISDFYFSRGQLSLIVNGASVATNIGFPFPNGGSSMVHLHVSGTVHLNANDRVWIETAQYNSSNTAEPISSAYFCGHIVTID